MKIKELAVCVMITILLAGCGDQKSKLVPSSSQELPSVSSEALSSNSDDTASDSDEGASDMGMLSPSLLDSYQFIEYETPETLTRDDLLLLLNSGYRELSAAYDLPLPTEITGEGTILGTPSPVPPYSIIFSYFNAEEQEGHPKCLWTNQEIFGVKPGEPLEKFWSYFGEKAVRYGYFESDQYQCYVLYYIRDGIRYVISSSYQQEPVYNTLYIEPVEDIPRYSTEDPYLRIAGRDTAELTVEDYSRLLKTPAGRLVEIYDLPPRNVEQQIHDSDGIAFLRFHNNAQLPIYNMTVHFSGLEDTECPAQLEVYGPCAELLGIPMRGSFEDLEKEWGPGETYFYGNALGNNSSLWRGVRYEKEGLSFNFECSEAIWWENHYADSEAGIYDPPKELWPPYLDRVYIYLSDY